MSLHYVECSAQLATSIVLLHGFPEDWHMWRFLIPMVSAFHRVVAVDLRGYGRSSKPRGGQGYDKRTMAEDVHALVEHLGLVKPLVVGHDRGARVARRLALDHPRSVAGVALLDILPAEWVYDRITAGEAARKYWHWVFHLVPGVPEQLVAGREQDYLRFFFRRTPRVLQDMEADGTWQEYARAVTEPGAFEAMLEDYRSTFAVDVPRYRAERAAGRRLDVPALLLWGELGNLAGQPVEEIWMEVASRVDAAAQLAGCGHYLPEEQPEIVADHVLRFASRCFHPEG